MTASLCNVPAAGMSAESILAAVDGYRGWIVDLDRAVRVSPGEFAAGRETLARRMTEAGLRTADRVIIAVGNGPQFIAAWAVILSRGGSPLLVHVETPPAELKRISERFAARFVVTDAQQESDLRLVASRTSTLACHSWLRLVWGDFGEVASAGGRTFLELPGVPLHPTSGTTGQPKVAVRPAGRAIAEAEHYVETIGIDHRDTILALAPMSHAYAHGWGVVTPMVTGASVVTMRAFNAKMVFRACKEHGITVLPAVAAMLDMLLFGAGKRLYDPSRRVITGGAPLAQRTATQFEKISGARVRPLYGTTETGAVTIARPGDRPAIGGCVGRPFDGVSVQIRPPANPTELAPGVGLVHVQSPSLMLGYLSDEALDTSPLADGWFNTGDLGRIDQDGAVHLVGRQAEVINVSGLKVLPSEVEEVIAALGGIVEVKVYPGKTRSGSHYVKAAVVAGNGIDANRIKAHCEQHLVYYKRPARILMLDALPRSPGGKILREQLP